MAKFNWKVFKKGKTLYWVVGAVVLFVVFYLIASKGAGSASQSSGITTIQSGPSDAALATNAAITQAQIQGSVASTIAGYELAAKKEDTAAQVAIASLAAQVQSLNITSEVAALKLQSEFSLETAKVAAETNLAIAGVNLQGMQVQTAAQIEAQRIASQGDIAMATLQAGVASQQIGAAVRQTEIQSFTALALGAQSADVAKTQIMASSDVAKTQLTEGSRQIIAQLASNEAMFNKSVEGQSYIAQLQADVLNRQTNASVNIAGINASTALQQSYIAASQGVKQKDRDNYLISLALNKALPSYLD